MSSGRHFLLSVHDVAPVHLGELDMIEGFLDEMGVSNVNYLLVPDFHNSGLVHENKPFLAWSQRVRTPAATAGAFSNSEFVHGTRYGLNG